MVMGKLTDAKWDADETDGWEMSAIANYILKGKGVYRLQPDSGLSFMVLIKIKKVENWNAIESDWIEKR